MTEGATAARRADLEKIAEALEAARAALEPFTPGAIEVQRKEGGDPVTEADHAVDAVLRELLTREGEGWLSEETVDDLVRLDKDRVWVVDPVDGTKEFVTGIPEWCVSVGLVESGRPVAGGILNPATGQLVLGAEGLGVTLNGRPVAVPRSDSLSGGVVLASRSEIRRGEWERFEGRDFEVRPCGSVAYKLGMVAAGEVEATWSLVPKNEWDVVAGVALVRAAGGWIHVLDEPERRFNRKKTLLAGLVACGPGLEASVAAQIGLAAVS